MKQTKSYKLIYLIVLWGFLCGSLAVNIPKAAAATSSKQLLTQADFNYIGAFAMPYQGVSGDPTFGRGLTHRYVNGELHLISMSNNPASLYEVRVPTLSQGSSLQVAPVVKEWGESWINKAYTPSGQYAVYGMYWDEQDKRLYWAYGLDYNAATDDDPSIGYNTLNDAAGTATSVGVWRLNGHGQKSAMGCVVGIPQWFADAYTGGKRLGAGCGGYFSIITNGEVSMGPALAAFLPPTSPDRSSIAWTNLVEYAFSSPAYSTPDRCHRDPNYSAAASSGDWLGWAPRNGIGYWTAGDYMWQGAVWIDTPDKSGLVFFPTLSNGNVWYETSTLHGSSVNHWWYVYDPADLAKVAQGQKQSWEIQPAAEWQVKYPGLSYPLPEWRDLPYNLVVGATYDSSPRRLYVAVRHAAQGYGTYGATEVYVYEVQSGSNPPDATPPAAPGNLRIR